VVYDDWFETVYAPAEQAPDQWEHLCTFNRYETHFDKGHAPMLADEWLTPAEQEANHAKKRVQGLRQERRQTWQDSFEKESRDDFSYQAPLQDPPLNAPTREQVEQIPAHTEAHPASPTRELSTLAGPEMTPSRQQSQQGPVVAPLTINLAGPLESPRPQMSSLLKPLKAKAICHRLSSLPQLL